MRCTGERIRTVGQPINLAVVAKRVRTLVLAQTMVERTLGEFEVDYASNVLEEQMSWKVIEAQLVENREIAKTELPLCYIVCFVVCTINSTPGAIRFANFFPLLASLCSSNVEAIRKGLSRAKGCILRLVVKEE